MIGEQWRAAWGTLRLRTQAIQGWQRQRDSLAWGLGLLFMISLLAGLAEASVWTSARWSAPPPWVHEQQVANNLENWLAYSPLPQDAQRELTRNIVAGLDWLDQWQRLPRPLGRQASDLLQGLQRAISAPYRRLAIWLPYTLLVFALARALGGRATLQGMLGASALYVLPHLLDPLRGLPLWGPLVGLVTFSWGVAIYVKAIAVVNELDLGRTLLAALLPALIALTMALLLLRILLWVI